MIGGTRSIDAVRLWTVVLSMTYALALPQILWIQPAVLKDERLAPLAAPFVVGMGSSSVLTVSVRSDSHRRQLFCARQR